MATIFHSSKCYCQAINGDLAGLLTQTAAKKGVLFRVDSCGVLWSLLNFVVASKIVGILSVFSY
ncbi:MAG: hypothetical protein JNM36_14315 [Chitinophagales bacterium]|nr:hypothetical protein [Chitinophagales bacterium]